MNCIKCGREIPDGELFCVECSLAPEKRESARAPSRQQHKAAAPRPQPRQKPHGTAKPQPQKRRTREPAKKRPHRTVIAIVLLSLLLAASLAFIALSYGHLARERIRLRTREADLQVRENEAEELRREQDSLSQRLAAAEEENRKLRQEADQLNRQLNDSEGSVSQAQYDMTSQQQELERLTKENQELLDAADELDRQIKDLTGQVTTLTGRADALGAANAVYSAKADFMDSYVVFVNNDGSKLYHSYDCKKFTRQNFWAYSRKLAESNGFSPCPDCQAED